MTNPVSWILDQIRRLNDVIWNTSLSEISKRKSFILKQMRIFVLAARGFTNDKVQLRASSLTFYSLLSIIPFAAIVFAIAKGFNVDNNIKIIIHEKFQSQAANLNCLVNEAQTAIEKTSGGYMAGVGIIILFWSDRKSTRLNSSHANISYAVFCLKK